MDGGAVVATLGDGPHSGTAAYLHSNQEGGSLTHPNLPETTAHKTHEGWQAAQSHSGNECPSWDFNSDLSYFKTFIFYQGLRKEAIWSTPIHPHLRLYLEQMEDRVPVCLLALS